MTPESQIVQLDTTRGRVVQRTVQVYAAPPTLALTWPGAECLVVVYRQGTRQGHSFQTTSFYLTSLKLSAVEAALGIRLHRDIENGLHWVRDVVFCEDAAPFPQKACALNWSILRSLALNLFRTHGYHSLTRALRLFSHDLSRLFCLLTGDAPAATAAFT